MLYDEQPTSFRVSIRQRTRWTQGGLQVSIKYAGCLVRGILRGGRTGWASFETATLSLWGYGLSAICGGVTLMLTFMAGRWHGIMQAVLLALLGTYLSCFAIGVLTLLTEWHRIRATKEQKILAAFSFPLYMISFLPIAATALFRKFQWLPVEHTAAISAGQLQP